MGQQLTSPSGISRDSGCNSDSTAIDDKRHLHSCLGTSVNNLASSSHSNALHAPAGVNNVKTTHSKVRNQRTNRKKKPIETKEEVACDNVLEIYVTRRNERREFWRTCAVLLGYKLIRRESGVGSWQRCVCIIVDCYLSNGAIFLFPFKQRFQRFFA